MTTMSKIGTTATNVTKDGDTTKVTYHNTAVVTFTDDKVTLNTGGWFTKTTKDRMNQVSNVFDLGFTVYQEKKEWFVWLRESDQRIQFDGDKVTFARSAAN